VDNSTQRGQGFPLEKTYKKKQGTKRAILVGGVDGFVQVGFFFRGKNLFFCFPGSLPVDRGKEEFVTGKKISKGLKKEDLLVFSVFRKLLSQVTKDYFLRWGRWIPAPLVRMTPRKSPQRRSSIPEKGRAP